MIKVDRAQWLGYRWQRHGFDGQASGGVPDDLLLLGVQGSRQFGPELALIQRTHKVDEISPTGPLVNLWSVRGAPHVHRVTDLDFIRDALAPQDTDAGGPQYVEAVREVAAALKAVVTGPTSKGDASGEVSSRVSSSLLVWCERCQGNHVPDGWFRAAGRQAQLVLGPEEQRATMLYPTPKQPQEKVPHPRRALLAAYFRLNGPTSRTLYRDWIDADATPVWQELDGVRVQVENRRYELPEELLEDLQQAPAARGVVLVPPHDPYLRQVDRTLLVPDSSRRKEVWRALSPPGALLVDGEVAGTWRYRRGEHELTITSFESLPRGQRRRAEENARRIAEAADDDQLTVTWAE